MQCALTRKVLIAIQDSFFCHFANTEVLAVFFLYNQNKTAVFVLSTLPSTIEGGQIVPNRKLVNTCSYYLLLIESEGVMKLNSTIPQNYEVSSQPKYLQENGPLLALQLSLILLPYW